MSAPRINAAAPIPAHVLARMRPEDRPAGAAGMLPAEIHAKAVEKAEKALQDDVRRYLALIGVEYICPPMHKRSLLPAGWPDFTVFLPGGRVLLWECKAARGALSPEQAQRRDRLQSLGHNWRLIRDVSECKEHLRELGVRP